MTIRRKNFAADEVLTESDLEAYCQDNGVIKCDYVSELASLPSSINTAYVVETAKLYVKTSGTWRIVPTLDADGTFTASSFKTGARIKTDTQLEVWNAGQTALTTVAAANPTYGNQLATKDYVDSLSAKPTVTGSPWGTQNLKMYHNSHVTTLLQFFVFYAWVPIPSGIGYPVITANVGDNTAGLTYGQSLRVGVIEPSNNRAQIWWQSNADANPSTSVGAAVRINYVVYYT